jgi:hypothetical protein
MGFIFFVEAMGFIFFVEAMGFFLLLAFFSLTPRISRRA